MNKTPKTDRVLTAIQNFQKALLALEEAVLAPIVAPLDMAGIV